MRIRSKIPPPPRSQAHKRRNKTLPRKAKHKKPPAMGAYQFMKEYIMFDSVDELVTVVNKTRQTALKEILKPMIGKLKVHDVDLLVELGKYSPTREELESIVMATKKTPSQ